MAGAGALGLGATVLAGCGVRSDSPASSGSGGAAKTLKIGYVSPATGFAAGFGDVDPYVIQQFAKALSGGVAVGGTSYQVQFVLKDSKFEPQSAAQAATELIASGVDLLLVSSTPETVNPVADAAEAARVPCLSAVCPWEAFYLGRGATPDKPFKYTYHAQPDDLFAVLVTLLLPRGIWGELVHRTGWAVAPVGYVVRSRPRDSSAGAA